MKPLFWVVLLALLFVPPPPAGVAPPFARAGAGTPPLAAGVHAPNRGWEEADFGRMADGHFGGVKMMSYHRPSDYARLRRDNPGLDFTVRLDSPWNELPPPADFVAFHAPRLRALVDAGFSPWVEIGNEPNLELHPGAEAAFASWYLETLSALRVAVPELRYGFPGLAVDQRELEWLDANAAAVAASDWLGVHAYWTSEREMLDPHRALKLVEYHRRFPDKPLLVTEAGNNAAGVPPGERARQYARFTRTVAELPYVRALHYFILSGTVDWRLFFFDDLAIAAVRAAPREPVPLVSGLEGMRRDATAAILPLVSGPPVDPGDDEPGPVPPAPPLPAPAVPAARRRMIADGAPAAAVARVPAVPHSTAGRWVLLDGAAGPPTAPAGAVAGSAAASPALSQIAPAGADGPVGLRSASGYLATDLALHLEVTPPAAGTPCAVWIADAGRTTGFSLLWDGGGWRLQYRRDGEVLEDHLLDESAAPLAGGRLQVEMAIEPRSVAAWIWPVGEAQPAAPQAVFAPPAVAATDATSPRYVVLPALPVTNVSLEGLTRFS
jgi:hypothetical protein